MDDFLEILEAAVSTGRATPWAAIRPSEAGFLSLDTLPFGRVAFFLDRAERRGASRRRNTNAASGGPALPVDYVVITRWDDLRNEARRSGAVLGPGPESRAALLERLPRRAARDGRDHHDLGMADPRRLGGQGRPQRNGRPVPDP